MKTAKKCAILSGLVLLLVFTYLKNPFDPYNTAFPSYQADSESLVGQAIVSAVAGEAYPLEWYGLGRVQSVVGKRNWDYFVTGRTEKLYTYFLTDKNFKTGIGLEQPIMAIPTNPWTEKYITAGGAVEFKNGERRNIESVWQKDEQTYIRLEQKEPIDSERCGQIWEYKIYDLWGKRVPAIYLQDPYVSQFGLQGKLAYWCTKAMGEAVIPFLYFVNSLFMAIVVVSICLVLRKKYNVLMAICWYAVFWLYPFVVNFARNLYWVEFTWFMPMLIGLYLSYRPTKKVLCWGGAFAAICIKSLCGYEYLSTIILGSMIFLLTDLLLAKGKKKQLFFNIVGLGTAELMGFSTAFIIHSFQRGGGGIFSRSEKYIFAGYYKTNLGRS